MNKKKVIELIKKGMLYQSKSSHVSSYKEKAKNCFEEALNELQKSDWISVEDGLPEYGEKVFACDKEMKDYPFVTMRYKGGKEKLIDTNGFRSGLYVTHWKPIEKLEE